MAEKNVMMLVALVEQSSQELHDLYRKVTNFNVKTVLEGGHNNPVDGYTVVYYSCVFCDKKPTINAM